MNLNHKTDARAGVTLIEMLVVVTIIALFAAIVGPKLLQHGSEARVVAVARRWCVLGRRKGTVRKTARQGTPPRMGTYPSGS